MLRLLLTPRWLSFTAFALLAILAFGALSSWQWQRAEEKRQENSVVVANTTGSPVSLDTAASDPSEWQRVEVTGQFTGDQFLLRNRPLDGRQGFWVVSSLAVTAEAANKRVIWVARGWLPQRTAATSSIEPPPLPTDEVSVTGYLRGAGSAAAIPSASFPEGQIAAINTRELNEVTGQASYPDVSAWYLQQADSTAPNSDLSALPLPEANDARNLSYAGQWLLFAAIAIGGWFYFLRREAQERRGPADDSETATDAGQADSPHSHARADA